MKHYVVNRKSRPDRLLLWKGAMAAHGVSADRLVTRVAMDKDDYKNASAICETARVEFPEFFSFHLEYPQSHVGFGHLICSWSVMQMWKAIAGGQETAVGWLDDYALRRSESKLQSMIDALSPDVLQLAWHYRPDIFEWDKYDIPVKWVVPPKLIISPKHREVFLGANGGSDWANVLSPRGAGALLQFMAEHPYFNTEVAIQAYALAHRGQGVFSVRANDPTEIGTAPLRRNRWVVHLWDYTDGDTSDLAGSHYGVK